MREDVEALPNQEKFKVYDVPIDPGGQMAGSKFHAERGTAGCSLDDRRKAGVLPGVDEDTAFAVEGAGVRDVVQAERFVKGRLWVPVEGGCQFALPNKQNTVVRTVKCFHTTQDIGYIVCETEKTMRGATDSDEVEFAALKERGKNGDKTVGKEIGAMRKAGRIINVEKIAPKVAYLLDSTVQVLGECAGCTGDPTGNSCEFMGAGAPFGEPCLTGPAMAKQ